MDAASSEWKGSKRASISCPSAARSLPVRSWSSTGSRLVEKYPSTPSRTASMRRTGRLAAHDEGAGRQGPAGRRRPVRHRTPSACPRAFRSGCGNSILIKLNQIGSVSETLETIKMAHKAGYTAIASPPLRQDRGHYDCRPGRCAEHLPDQDRRSQPPASASPNYSQLLRIEEGLPACAVSRVWGV